MRQPIIASSPRRPSGCGATMRAGSVPDHEEAITSAWSLEQLLTTLKPAQSQVIRLVKLQGLSIEEASKASGQSATLVKSLLHSESDAD